MTSPARLGRASLRAALLVALALPAPADAQSRARDGGGGRLPRSLLFAAIGAATAAAASSAFFFTSSNDRTPSGMCTDKACVVPVSIGAGALVGYLIGREFDQLHALRYRGGAPLSPSVTSVAVPALSTELALRDATLAVGGAGGVQIVTAGENLKLAARRASGVRGIAAIDLAPGSGALAVGSQAGFYLYPPRTGPGSLVREGAVTAIAAAAERSFVGVGTRIEVIPAGVDTTRVWPGVDVGAAPSALAFDQKRGVLWALVDSSLVALRPEADSLAIVSRTAVRARGLGLSLLGDRVAAALGESGVVLVDAADPAAPRELARWTGARFAYDVSLAGRRLYVAAGVEGVYVLDTEDAGLPTEGLARELGFAIALASEGGYTFVLDRTTNSVRRFASDF